MPAWLINLLASLGTVLLTLIVTFIFNKLIGFPRELKHQKEAAAQMLAQQKQDNLARDKKIAELETVTATLPTCRLQSVQAQERLQAADSDILAACQQIQTMVLNNQQIITDRLDRLENREKNSLREKILREYRLMCSDTLNPLKAWTEMEHQAFFALVHDYEDLGGNDYVHTIVIPAINLLDVIAMSDTDRLTQLYNTRDRASRINNLNKK